MKTKPNNEIMLLSPIFRNKIKLFLSECKRKWFNIWIYEWFRTINRQIELYNQWRITKWKIVTWTLKSKHLQAEAVDIIFYDAKWNITWNWPYDKIIEISKQFWIDSLSPIETCHFQDNWKPLLNNINTMNKSPYTVIHENILWTTWFKSLFDNFEENEETKQLIDIAFARYHQRLLSWTNNKI